jgi:hypothetical protein
MNKILSIVLFVCVFVCQPIYVKSEEVKLKEPQKLYASQKKSLRFEGYAIDSGLLYILFWHTDSETIKKVLLKYVNGNLEESLITKKEAAILEGKLLASYDNREKIEINKNKYIFLKDKYKEAGSERNISFIDGDTIKELAKEYGIFYTMFGTVYYYIDCVNNKFYFSGVKGNYSAGTGIFVWDFILDKCVSIREDINGIIPKLHHYDPIRVPNTEFLLYRAGNGSWSIGGDYSFEIWIQEIPEWKAEIEKQEENKKLYPNTKKAFIDGPANIRDTPKGKSVAMLNSFTEVLILNQQGGWYEVLYADVRGWTYKDNLKDIK